VDCRLSPCQGTDILVDETSQDKKGFELCILPEVFMCSAHGGDEAMSASASMKICMQEHQAAHISIDGFLCCATQIRKFMLMGDQALHKGVERSPESFAAQASIVALL
jgi:hypothetical protein